MVTLKWDLALVYYYFMFVYLYFRFKLFNLPQQMYFKLAHSVSKLNLLTLPLSLLNQE